jgi:hypothetical protein
MNYYEYIKSPEWKNKREWALKFADYKCQVCRSVKNLNVHHSTYQNLGEEKPGDIIVLCKDCHEKFHNKLPETPKAVVPTQMLTCEEKKTILFEKIKRYESGETDEPKISKRLRMVSPLTPQIIVKEVVALKKRILELDVEVEINQVNKRIGSETEEEILLNLLREQQKLIKSKMAIGDMSTEDVEAAFDRSYKEYF